MNTQKFTGKAIRSLASRILMASLALMILLSSVVPPASAAAPLSNDWVLNLTTLKVTNADEDGDLSDGDEPYLIPIGFRTIVNKPNSTQAFWGGSLYEVHDGADGGDWAYMQNRMGTLHFPDVRMVGIQDLLAGKYPEMIGAVVIAMESDATPFDDLRPPLNGFVKNLNDSLKDFSEKELKNLYDEYVKPELNNLDAKDIQELKNLKPANVCSNKKFSGLCNALKSYKNIVADKIKFDFKKQFIESSDLLSKLLSVADHDDVISIQLFLYMGIDLPIELGIENIDLGVIDFGGVKVKIPKIGTITLTEFGEIPVKLTGGLLSPHTYSIGSNPVVFKRNGSTFEVTARLDNIQYYGVNIRAAHSNKCLDVGAEKWTQDTGVYQQWDCFGPNQLNQRFVLIPDGNGYYQITGAFDNQHMCLSTTKASAKNGIGIHQWHCKGLGQNNQLWQLKPMGNGYYQIINKNAGKCLDVAYENATYVDSNGARLQQYDCLGANQLNQIWYFANP